MLSEDAQFYHSAFLSLMRERQSLAGFSIALPLPLARDVIEAHARREGIDPGELREYVAIVAMIDDTFVEFETRRILAELKSDADRRRTP